MLRWLLAWLAFGVATAAHAEGELAFGPPPPWVVAVDVPPPSPAAGGLEIRLLDSQTRIDDAGLHQFGREILRLSSPAAVQGAGTVTITWQPAYGRATVHKIEIRRGPARIDVLKSGATFNVIRREAALESAAQINGLLTGVLQVPDLRVGDEIEFAYSIDQRNPALRGHNDLEATLSAPTLIDRLFMRYSWPQHRNLWWRAGDRLPAAKTETRDGLASVLIAADNLKPPRAIPGAPTRYLDSAAIQVSDFASWRDLAEVIQPLFVTASEIAPDSPINEEIRKIAQSSPDPVGRAGLALQLVQSQVRYFARVDGLGGFVPEHADAVWRARSGDCKGKTALLLALLHGLGVEAEPALVATRRGDGLDKVLPMAGRFNHALVRATIGGRVYWLDGARTADRSLDQLTVPPYKWALLLGAKRSGLEALAAAEPKRPTTEWRLDLDARAGRDVPAKAHGVGVFRGDTAAELRVAASLLSKDALDQAIRNLWRTRHDWVTIEQVSYEDDPAAGEVRVGFSGTGKMDWDTDGPTPGYRYEANKACLGESLAPSRDPELADLAPVLIGSRYSVVHQTILLPDGGKGFFLQGDPIDETIAGVHYQRSLSLKDGRFDLTTVTRSAEGEISYAEAKAADRKVDAVFAKQVFIHLPQGAPRTIAKDPAAAVKLAEARELMSLMAPARLLQQGKPEETLSALDKLELRGEARSDGLALRGMALRRLNRLPEANAALDEALALDRQNKPALMAKTELLLGQHRAEDALILADRLVLIAPEKAEPYELRGYVRRAMQDNPGALSDWNIAVEKNSRNAAIYVNRLNLLYGLGQHDTAISEAERLATLFPDNANAQAARASMLARAGRLEEASKAATLSVRIAPNADAYLIRIHYGLSGGAEATLDDMVAVIRLEPGRELPEADLRRVLKTPGALSRLQSAYDAAKPANADQAAALLTARASLDAALGNPETLLARYDEALSQHPRDADLLNRACWMRGTHAVQLDKALANCDAAVAIDPQPHYLDSRALVRLRLKAYAQAIADYDAALAKEPRLPSSLFGRGLAKLRTGDRAGGSADLDAARKLEPEISDMYAGMGLQP